MTSFRQIEANRRNAVRSTGPKLTAETVIDELEDSEDYQAFEAVAIADYDMRNAAERERVLRLASLLRPLRRIISIGTISSRSSRTSFANAEPCFADHPNPR